MAVRHRSDQRSGPAAARSVAVVAIWAVSALLLSACSEDEPPGPTIEERLAEAEGRELTATEVDEKLALGDTLCRMDEPVLGAIWLRLNDEQMAYQDVVFGHLCPERSIFYASQTGRVVTEEAENSDLVTSTTGPSEVTTTGPTSTGPTTSGQATSAPSSSSPATTADPVTTSSSPTPTSDPDPSESTSSTVTTSTNQTTESSQSTTTGVTTTTPTTGSTGPGEGG